MNNFGDGTGTLVHGHTSKCIFLHFMSSDNEMIMWHACICIYIVVNSLAYSLKLQHNFFSKLYTVILSLIHLFLVFFYCLDPYFINNQS